MTGGAVATLPGDVARPVAMDSGPRGTVRASILLGWRMFWREWRAGELRLALFALVLAVAGSTAVGFLQSRVEGALEQGAAALNAADLSLIGDQPAAPRWLGEAATRHLQVSQMALFPSMLRGPQHSVLASVKAVDDAFPLRGQLRLEGAGGQPGAAVRAPARGQAYLAPGLAARLGLQPGQPIGVGRLSLSVAGVIAEEPEGGLSGFRMAPRVLINLADLSASGLVRPGARVTWRLALAGTPAALDHWRRTVEPALQAGQRLERATEGRPEVRRVIDQAGQFLQLASLTSLMLASVALLFALRRHGERQAASVALLRCLGAGRAQVWWVQGSSLACLGLLGAIGGIALGALLQFALAAVVAPLIGIPLPPPGWLPVAQGLALTAILLPALAWPSLAALLQVQALQVLREQAVTVSGWHRLLGALPAPLAVLLVGWLVSASLRLAAATVLALLLTGLLAAALAGLLLWLVHLASAHLPVSWRHALRALRERPWFAALQAGALAVSLMVMLTLGVVREDLLRTWQSSVPPDAPNHFVIGIQAGEREALTAFMRAHGQPALALRPLVRARLVSIDDQPVLLSQFTDPQARALLDREANLSWADQPNPDNRIVAGQWWPQAPLDAGFSVETSFADRLHLKVGTRLGFDLAGQLISARVGSLRTVRWDSFQPNFFVLVKPGLLDGEDASYIASFRIAPGDTQTADALVAAFPQVSLIDTGALIAQVRAISDQVVLAIQLVFGFSLVAGLAVLLAGLGATHDARLREGALLRALGATRAQLRRLQAVEFSLLGLAAGLAAAIGTLAVSWALSRFWLDLPWQPDWRIPLLGSVAGVLLVRVAAAWSLRPIGRALPAETLRMFR